LSRSEGELNHEIFEVLQFIAFVGFGERWIFIVESKTRSLARIIALGNGSLKDSA
jgi:hypothetical protein